nr:UDP-glycosyltransferase 91A1-like [Ipomoea batatas]
MQRPPSTSRYDDVKYLKKAHDGLREAMAKFLQESRPDWVFSISMLTELLGTGGRVLASEFGVSTVFFKERRWIGRGAFSTYSSEDSRLFNDVVPKPPRISGLFGSARRALVRPPSSLQGMMEMRLLVIGGWKMDEQLVLDGRHLQLILKNFVPLWIMFHTVKLNGKKLWVRLFKLMSFLCWRKNKRSIPDAHI